MTGQFNPLFLLISVHPDLPLSQVRSVAEGGLRTFVALEPGLLFSRLTLAERLGGGAPADDLDDLS